MRPDYVVVAGGRGRSGTNWVVRLFNFSPATFCRKYPHRLEGSPMRDLIDPLWRMEGDEALQRDWERAVRWAALRMGKHDQPIEDPKEYIHEASRRIGLTRLVCRPGLRRALGLVLPALRHEEWPLPLWLGRREQLAEALPVLKLGIAAPFVLRYRPGHPVFHVVRHPGGFLNSWMRRYLPRHDPEDVADANRRRLHWLTEQDPAWAACLPDIDQMDVMESELWYWRFVNERIAAAGEGSDDYHRIIYEELAQEPVRLMRHAYEVCGLPWTDEVEQRIRAHCADSGTVADQWKRRLSREQIDLVDRVLETSPMRDWWPRESGVEASSSNARR